MIALPTIHPRLIPTLAALVVGGTLVCATAARLTGFANPPAGPAPIATMALNFADAPGGGIAVHNATTGALVALIPARDDGFLRMTIRILAVQRMHAGFGASIPFTLSEFPGGDLRLNDPSTGQSVELQDFGPSNIAQFRALFSVAESPIPSKNEAQS